MRSGYRLQWSERATLDLQNVITYLQDNWTEKEVRSFIRKLDKRLTLISANPRRSVLTKQTVIYYETSTDVIKIVTLFDTRQDPRKLKV